MQQCSSSSSCAAQAVHLPPRLLAGTQGRRVINHWTSYKNSQS